MLQAAAEREGGGARAWCSLLDACEAEVKGLGKERTVEGGVC